ncbi:hypothetical protein [Desertibacillus haloalkaliphilus]|uniref:hypothetical protein n=1 Tax=Desertibacillus haloalkaliphilus TaxID=1328930 RepID=UPI001C253704|nr:hypothetical protein [Desertibacillus haloalkaliphilus]MBU8905946.1 hypothetical protein [Desertibacillus haloalkaliphilus]
MNKSIIIIAGVVIVTTIVLVSGFSNFNNQTVRVATDAQEIENNKERNKELLVTNEDDDIQREADNSEVDDVSTETEEQTTNGSDVAAASSEEGSQQSTNSSNNESSSPSSTNNSSSNSQTSSSDGNNEQSQQATESKSLQEIKSEYFLVFQSMEREHTANLDRLIQQAYRDYVDNGAENVNVDKYRSEASALESSADASFYATYEQLKVELGEHGYSQSEATEFKETYERKKQSRRNELESIVN